METAHVSIHKHEETPKNRKDLVLMSAKAIRDARDLDDKIAAHINFINIAMPEIPAETYPRDRIYTLKPPLKEIIDEYTSYMNFIVPEQIQRHMPFILRLHKERYLEKLQSERAQVEDLLKKYTNWFFDGDRKVGPAR